MMLSTMSIFALGIMFLAIIGCDDTQTMIKPVINAVADNTTKPATSGKIKHLEKADEVKPIAEQPEIGLLDRIPPPVTDFFIPADQMSAEPDKNPDDFVGRVYAPSFGRSETKAQPIIGVTVTIMTGSRAEESVTTEKGGYYLFQDVEEDELHLLVEKEHFEPKGVIVHRFRPTKLANGAVPNYRGDIQRHPGNILIGQQWPDEVRFMLEGTLLPHDLLYVDGGVPPEGEGVLYGYYSHGVVVIYGHHYDWQGFILNLLGTFAHEIAHAHQHAMVSVDGSAQIDDWVNTPEGLAYIGAREKDLEKIGKTELDFASERNHSGRNMLLENAAEICSFYWCFNRWGWVRPLDYGNLKVKAPNRYKWAEQWLKK